jgi:hypothetical protein
VEDPFLWYEDGRVQALMKDMTGEIGGEKFAGVHVTSPDGIAWSFDRATLAYSRQLRSESSCAEAEDLWRGLRRQPDARLGRRSAWRRRPPTGSARSRRRCSTPRRKSRAMGGGCSIAGSDATSNSTTTGTARRWG